MSIFLDIKMKEEPERRATFGMAKPLCPHPFITMKN